MVSLRKSTATAVVMGPFLDKSDGVTEETALTPTVRLWKTGAVAWSARNSADAITHLENGWYLVPLSATDTDTAGTLKIKANDSATYLPVWHEMSVESQSFYDARFENGITDIADAVWDEALSGHTTDGTAGAALGLIDDIKAKTDQIGSGSATYIGPVGPAGAVTIYQGTDYHLADGTALTWSYTGAVNLSGAAVTLDLAGTHYAGAVSGSSGAWTITVNLTAAQTSALALGPHPYEIRAVLASGRKAPPLGTGTATVRADR